MSLIKRTNGGMTPFRSLLSDFFDADDFNFNRLMKNENMPAVNISETDKTFEIELAAPGMEKKDFKVAVENGILTISAEKKEQKEEKNKNFTRKEFSFSSFTRSFTLPENVKEEDIKAHYENGVLQLSLAKKAVTVSKAKEIAVV
jgi:HSP20 family protein